MAGHVTPVKPQDIEHAVHHLVLQRRRITFTVLSQAFPQYTWQTLFQVLHYLQKNDLVILRPLLWDYEIVHKKTSHEPRGRSGDLAATD
ncbi:MAG: hypothetical protein ABI980_07220 [Nitrospirota bacterium]